MALKYILVYHNCQYIQQTLAIFQKTIEQLMKVTYKNDT